MENLTDARVLVVAGDKKQWFDLYEYGDLEEFQKACKAFGGLKIEKYEELPDEFVTACRLNAKFFECRDELSSLNEEQQEAFFVWCMNFRYNFMKENVCKLLEDFKASYQGRYMKNEDFAREYLENAGIEIPAWMIPYFDYEGYAEMLFNCGDYWENQGFVFMNC